MSCGSATGNSTSTLDAASSPLQFLRRRWKTSLAWLGEIALGLERQHKYERLLELDDRLLADIGISRPAVGEVRRSPLYMLAWRDSR
jgi:uncharacterized protein YjiS (DUF1127 family)